MNLQPVFALDQPGFDVYAPGSEHVVGFENLLAVEEDAGIGVKSFADQLDPLSRQQLFIRREPGAIEPIPFADPLHELFIDAVVGIRDKIVPHQVGMDAPGHFRFEPGGLVPVRAEGPAGVELMYHNLGQGGRSHQNDPPK